MTAVAGDPGDEDEERVTFRPFVGLAPFRHEEMCGLMNRKHDDLANLDTFGHARKWKPGAHHPLRESIVPSDGHGFTNWEPFVREAERVVKHAVRLMRETLEAQEDIRHPNIRSARMEFEMTGFDNPDPTPEDDGGHRCYKEFFQAVAADYERRACSDFAMEPKEHGVDIAEALVDGEWVGVMSAFHVALGRKDLDHS